MQAAFQYTFRDDPAFPVGLADVGLTRTWPTYDEWLAWGGDRTPGAGVSNAAIKTSLMTSADTQFHSVMLIGNSS